MAHPSPALLIPRNMNQYSSSSSTAVEKARSSFALFVGKLFCSSPSRFNLCHMDVVYVHMPPSTRIWVAKLRIPWPARHISHSRHLSHGHLCVHGRARQDWTRGAAPRCRTQHSIPLHPWEPLWAWTSVLLFLIFLTPESQTEIPTSSPKSLWKMQQLIGQTLLGEISSHVVVPAIFSQALSRCSVSFLCRQDFHFISCFSHNSCNDEQHSKSNKPSHWQQYVRKMLFFFFAGRNPFKTSLLLDT